MAQVDSSLNNPNDPTNPNNTPGAVNQPGQQTNQPATTGGGAGPVTATGAGNVTGQVVGTSNPSQPFQNIASYLSANAPQSQALAGQVAGQVSGAINQAQGDITNAATNFNQSVNTGYAPEHSDVIAGVAKDPTAVVAQGPQSVSDFLSNYNDAYTGPTDFTADPGYANLQSEVAAANAAAANTQTQPGVQTLLQQTEGPRATAGINNLDSLLLNLDPNNLGIIQNAAKPAAGLAPALTDAQTAGNANVTAAQAAAQQAKTNAQNAFNTASGNLSTGVSTGYNDAVSAAQNFNQNYNDIIARLTGTMPVGTDGGIQQLTPDEQAALNLNQSAIDQYAQANSLLQHYGSAPDSFLFGEPGLNALPSAGPVSLSSFLEGGRTATLPTDAASVATPQQYAAAQALQALSGGTYNSPLNPANAAEAGTYKLNGVNQTFDTSKANALIDAVTSRDKAVADNEWAQNSKAAGFANGLQPGDYAGLLSAINKNLASNPGGFNPSVAYEMDALNRLINGFSAPPVGYTPPTTPPPPSLGGAGPNPNPGGGGGTFAR